MFLDKGAEHPAVVGGLELIGHFQVVTEEFFHVRGIEKSVNPDHEAENGDDAEQEEEEGDKGEDLVIIQIDWQHAMTSVGQQITVHLW